MYTTSAERYSRQVALKQLGNEGQQKMRSSSVLVVGAGGLGCPALQYLAAAGIGTLGIVDGDVIAASNLNRQLLFTTAAIGKLKAEQAILALQALNPDLHYQSYPVYLDNANALEIIAPYDVVIDATDNFDARYLINDACVLLGKPMVYGSISRFEGQLSVFNYLLQGEAANYRDLFPEPPRPGEVLNCDETGVLGVLPGIIGTMQAAEAIKIVTGAGNVLQNRLLTFNLLRQEWVELQLTSRPGTRALLPANAEEFLAGNYQQTITDCEVEYQELDPAGFDQLLLEESTLVIDVREPGEKPEVTGFSYLSIPVSEIRERAPHFHHRTIVLFCHVGIRSAAVASLFPNDNVVYNLRGGIVKWLRYRQTIAFNTQ